MSIVVTYSWPVLRVHFRGMGKGDKFGFKIEIFDDSSYFMDLNQSPIYNDFFNNDVINNDINGSDDIINDVLVDKLEVKCKENIKKKSLTKENCWFKLCWSIWL